MDLSDLVIFKAVVENGSITRAAERLHRVPSNVTTRIRQLERGLSVELFHRQGKRLVLSETGAILFDYANKLLRLAEEAQDALHNSMPRGVFRLGASESVVATRLPEPLNEFHRRWPDVRLELQTAPSQRLLTLLTEGALDATFVAGPVSHPDIATERQYREELVLVTARGHKPVRRPRDVAGRTLLVFENGCAYRQRLEDWFQGQGAAIERLMEFSSYHAILGCAAVGMGVALVPRRVLEVFSERARLGVHRLAPEWRWADIVLAWPQGREGAKLGALKDVLRKWWGTNRAATRVA